MRALQDLVGERFGRGVVLSFVDLRGEGKHRLRYWRLRCDCGNEYEAATGNLNAGHKKSCGCLSKEAVTRNARLYATPACTKPPRIAAFNQLLAAYKKRAHERSLAWLLTKEEFRAFIYGDCHYCGSPPSREHSPNRANGKRGTSIVVNGVDRVGSSLGYTMTNCVSCCYYCNTSKNSRSEKDFLDWVARVYQHSLAREIGGQH